MNADDPVAVLAVFHPATGQGSALRDALVASIPAVHGEPGCELYAIHDGPDGVIYMVEKWTTVAELDAHGDGAPVKALQAAIDGLTTAVDVVRLAPIPAGTPTQGLL